MSNVTQLANKGVLSGVDAAYALKLIAQSAHPLHQTAQLTMKALASQG